MWSWFLAVGSTIYTYQNSLTMLWQKMCESILKYLTDQNFDGVCMCVCACVKLA